MVTLPAPFQIKEWVTRYMALQNPATQILVERNRRYWLDRTRQELLNNYWGNNPGELDRWADDGGRA